MYDVSSAAAIFSAPDILAVVFLGTIGGFLGSLYNYLVDKVVRTYSIINEYVPPLISLKGNHNMVSLVSSKFRLILLQKRRCFKNLVGHDHSHFDFLLFLLLTMVRKVHPLP